MALDEVLRITSEQTDVVLTGFSPHGRLHHAVVNESDRPAILVASDGTRVEIPPRTATAIPFDGTLTYRLACNDCGRCDGTHTPTCARA